MHTHASNSWLQWQNDMDRRDEKRERYKRNQLSEPLDVVDHLVNALIEMPDDEASKLGRAIIDGEAVAVLAKLRDAVEERVEDEARRLYP